MVLLQSRLHRLGPMQFAVLPGCEAAVPPKTQFRRMAERLRMVAKLPLAERVEFRSKTPKLVSL